MDIREFQLTDLDGVLSLMSMFNQYIQSIDNRHRTDYKLGSSEYFTHKMIDLNQKKQGAIYVAYDDNKLVGFISGHVDEQDEEERMETIPASPGMVDELFVRDDYRGQKIGKKLLEKMENYLRSKGCDIVRFAVFAPNTMARDFYKHQGYNERIIYMLKELNNN